MCLLVLLEYKTGFTGYQDKKAKRENQRTKQDLREGEKKEMVYVNGLKKLPPRTAKVPVSPGSRPPPRGSGNTKPPPPRGDMSGTGYEPPPKNPGRPAPKPPPPSPRKPKGGVDYQAMVDRMPQPGGGSGPIILPGGNLPPRDGGYGGWGGRNPSPGRPNPREGGRITPRKDPSHSPGRPNPRGGDITLVNPGGPKPPVRGVPDKPPKRTPPAQPKPKPEPMKRRKGPGKGKDK